MYPLDRLYVVLDMCIQTGNRDCEVLILLVQLVVVIVQLSDPLFEALVIHFQRLNLSLLCITFLRQRLNFLRQLDIA